MEGTGREREIQRLEGMPAQAQRKPSQAAQAKPSSARQAKHNAQHKQAHAGSKHAKSTAQPTQLRLTYHRVRTGELQLYRKKSKESDARAATSKVASLFRTAAAESRGERVAAAKEEERRQRESIKLGGVAEQVRPLELASTLEWHSSSLLPLLPLLTTFSRSRSLVCR